MIEGIILLAVFALCLCGLWLQSMGLVLKPIMRQNDERRATNERRCRCRHD